MATLRVDKTIVDFIKKVRDGTARFKGKALSEIVAESVLLLVRKHDKCFSCPHHLDQLAGLEAGRQKMAKDRSSPKPGAGWVSCLDDVVHAANEYAVPYRRASRDVVEQAILEHLTRPKRCASCPHYEEMRA